jgi:hypothetical protein
MLDEFDRLGHFEKLAEAMNQMAVYRMRACLVLQSLNQIYATYGANQSITDNCATLVRFYAPTVSTRRRGCRGRSARPASGTTTGHAQAEVKRYRSRRSASR